MAGSLLLMLPVALQNYLPRPRTFVFRSPVSLQALKNAECLFFTKPPVAFSGARNGRRTKLTLVAPLCAISLPPIGSGMSVLQAASKISVNLMAICIFVAWLQKSGQLPTETSTVLSQVAFRLTIPCFLMSKVSKTIAFQPQGILLSIPCISMLQIFVGAILGKALVRLIQKDSYLIPVNGSDGRLCMSQPSERDDEMLAKDDAIVIASCAFGNTITLPLVILSGILPPNEASTAAGFLALFVVGWSPFLWSYGYQMFNTTYVQSPPSDRETNRSFLQLCRIWIQRIMNPPLLGVLMGIIIGGTPLASVFFPSKPGTISEFFGKTDGPLAIVYFRITAFLQSVWEAASLLGSASVAVQAIVLACSVAPYVPLFDIDMKNLDGDQESETNIYGRNGTISQFVLDSQVFWAISCVRLLAMPLAGLLIVKILHWAHILPSNPICILTLLVLSAMPTAQNIVVLLQLRTSTRPLAGVLADLLVRQYALSLVSVPLWITAYTSVIPLM